MNAGSNYCGKSVTKLKLSQPVNVQKANGELKQRILTAQLTDCHKL